MTFLNATISNLEESKIYHEEQARLLQEEIDQASLSASYGDDAVSSVEAAIENIDPKHLELLKEHLLNLFSNNSKTVQTDLESSVTQEVKEVKEETPQEIIEEEVSDHVIDSQTDPLESVKSNPKYAKTKLTEEIYYDKETQTCYLGFSNRNRATEYGYHLLEIHELFEGKHGVDKPVVVTHCKWELVIQNITEDNAEKLKELNLKKVLSHKDNQAVTAQFSVENRDRAVWNTEEVLTEDVNIYIPKETVKKSEGLTVRSTQAPLAEKDFPSAPYKAIPLTEVEVCDVISTGEHITTYYEVTQNLGSYVKARCLYSRAFPNRINEEYTLSTAHLVERAFDIAVAV